jgi:hypothetical protein
VAAYRDVSPRIQAWNRTPQSLPTARRSPSSVSTRDQWARDFYPIFNRAGLIIDVRHNRGGNIDSWLLSKLMRQAWFYWQPRVGDPEWNMQYAFRGHLVVLCDQGTASDGEAFSEGFRRRCRRFASRNFFRGRRPAESGGESSQGGDSQGPSAGAAHACVSRQIFSLHELRIGSSRRLRFPRGDPRGTRLPASTPRRLRRAASAPTWFRSRSGRPGDVYRL